MCGIAGIFGDPGADREAVSAAVRGMTDALIHRGPDDAGIWLDAEGGIALGHRRLSILELSPLGHQPMRSASGRYTLAFNGEIYNFRELARELAGLGATFRGHSDTEVMLAAFDVWGVETAVRRFIGMFAFALWDAAERQLVLGVDRLGKKPVYGGEWQGRFLFASELKAICAFPDCRPAIDRGALALMMRHGYIPSPHCIYAGFGKLDPGTLRYVRREAGGFGVRTVTYWNGWDVAETGVREPLDVGPEEAVDLLESALREAVACRMVADVPVGAFLSGGIDSSTVVALMQAQSTRPVKTFSIGFQEQGYDEAVHAKAVARHLGTDHTELYVTSAEAMAVIPELPGIWDEPFADSSQIPTLLVSRMARGDVTVSLSGDGGDELFCGYPRYAFTELVRHRLGVLPRGPRRVLAAAISRFGRERWNAVYAAARPLVPPRWRVRDAGGKMLRLSTLLALEDPHELYRQMLSQWTEPTHLVKASVEPVTRLTTDRQPAVGGFRHWMMAQDMRDYLPGDILTKVDRASMAVSLEVRAPLLDHRVVELAWRMPIDLLLRDGEGKWPLRQLLYRHVPRSLVDRPKMGFGVPIDGWLRGPLRDWAESLLAPDRLRREGHLDVTTVRAVWQAHL
ncbi:MAG: asparagine synthase (glutamine-hydrolyzing), partial [Ectothiorhodospiraceae bacterium]|nr:asparagine synthase (glutamine-hydrolyzing) [Ectothiorhodospiraceae bacterium]